jgi:hypothetical protein
MSTRLRPPAWRALHGGPGAGSEANCVEGRASETGTGLRNRDAQGGGDNYAHNYRRPLLLRDLAAAAGSRPQLERMRDALSRLTLGQFNP